MFSNGIGTHWNHLPAPRFHRISVYASLDLTNQLILVANRTCAGFDGTPRAQRPESVQAASSASNIKKE